MTHWPYEDKSGGTCRMEADVLVLGGGVAGCMAAYAAVKRGQKVVLVERARQNAAGPGAPAVTTGSLPLRTPVRL